MRLELPLDRQLKILSSVAQLAENGMSYSEDLATHGFSAFTPWQKFEASFCAPDECDIHRRYVVEVAKMFIGTPSGNPGYLAWSNPEGYRSAFIEQLRAQRDATNGIGFRDIPESTLWCREIDPCARRKMRLLFTDRQNFEQRRDGMLRQHMKYKKSEAKLHTTGLGQNFGNGALDWARFQAAAFSTYLRPLGFEHDKMRSGTFFPVFSKKITPEWDLCFSLASEMEIKLQVKNHGEDRGEWTPLNICLNVRARDKRGEAPFGLGFRPAVMAIRYPWIVEGFDWSYGYFLDFDDWETSIKAYAHLYGLISLPLEKLLYQEIRTT